VKFVLSDFSCPKNQEIEHFVKHNALDFSKRKMSITYLVVDEQGRLAAIFALTHKAIRIMNASLSGTARKKIQRFAQLNENADSYMLSAFLIAQLGKNDRYVRESGEEISGDELMNMTMHILKSVQREVGGGIVYLECEEKPKLLAFYKKESNGFREFDERASKSDQTNYIQLMRFF
jgi:hypothetical protein